MTIYNLDPLPLFGNAFLLLVLTITMESEKRNTLGNLTNLTYLKMAFSQAQMQIVFKCYPSKIYKLKQN